MDRQRQLGRARSYAKRPARRRGAILNACYREMNPVRRRQGAVGEIVTPVDICQAQW
jgi:hypothetical protein